MQVERDKWELGKEAGGEERRETGREGETQVSWEAYRQEGSGTREGES